MDRLDRALHRPAPLPVERSPLGIEAGERLHDHVHRALRAHGVGPEMGVDERLRADEPGRREDRVHERAELEDARLAGAGAAREARRPGVEPEPHREDEARVGEADHVLRPRLVVVGVEAGGEHETHVEAVVRHPLREVEDREDRGRHQAPRGRAVRAGERAAPRPPPRPRRRRDGPTGRAARLSHVVRPPAPQRRRGQSPAAAVPQGADDSTRPPPRVRPSDRIERSMAAPGPAGHTSSDSTQIGGVSPCPAPAPAASS